MLTRFLEDARKKLIETGARNRLIHTPSENKRSKSVILEAADPDQVFNLLVRNRQPFGFLPAPERLPAVVEVGAHPRPLDSRNQAKLQTQLTPEGLQKRLLGLHRDARTRRRAGRQRTLFGNWLFEMVRGRAFGHPPGGAANPGTRFLGPKQRSISLQPRCTGR